MRQTGKLIAVLFLADGPIPKTDLCRNFSINEKELDKLIAKTNLKLDELGLMIAGNQEVSLVTQPNYASLVEEFFKLSPQPLSQTALEVLSIVAYKQPISKARIEEIRGVSSEQSLRGLLNKELIKKRTIKNEILYVTTSKFLNIMGIKSLSELPNFDGNPKT